MLFFLYDYFVRKEFHAKQELLAAKRSFIKFVSHEVRTPLNAVSMGLTVIQAEMAQSIGYKSPTDLQSVVDKSDKATALATTKQKTVESSAVMEWFELSQEIVRNTTSAVDILSDVLNYDKIESGTLSLELERIAIWQVVEDAVKEFSLAATKKRIDLQLRFSDNQEGVSFPSRSDLSKEMQDCKVIGDIVRITQVLRNLVSNALKFTPADGWVQVLVTWHRPTKLANGQTLGTFELTKEGSVSFQRNGHVEVQVKDTGAGISKDQLIDLFKEGMQFNANALQQGKGSGFGLFISKGIVAMHEGELRAESKGLGKGTVFSLTLPLYHAPSCNGVVVDPDNISSEHLLTDLSEPSSLHVLVVDDAASNRKLLSRLLEMAGHTCDTAEDGSIALRMVTEKMAIGEGYDTVLLDYEMVGIVPPEDLPKKGVRLLPVISHRSRDLCSFSR
jgi:signal transduction histidine kinase